MKKLFISLLAMAATVNAMAISFAGKATITLTSANNESCAIIVAESDELADGLNNGYYAVINMENREVALYAIYGGSNYQQFATKSLEDIALGVKTSAATDYTLTVSNVSGSKTLKLKIGDEVITIEELSEILDSGFSEIRIGIIPKSVDVLPVCDLIRSRFSDIKVLFFLGVNDGNIPRTGAGGGLLSDMERSALMEQGMELAPNRAMESFAEQLYLYQILTKPSEEVFLSYLSVTEAGDSKKPSAL